MLSPQLWKNLLEKPLAKKSRGNIWGILGYHQMLPQPVLGDSDPLVLLETVLRKQMEEFRTRSLARNTVRELADKVGISMNKVVAVVDHLGLRGD